MSSLAPADAAMFWRSRQAATDQYLLYCFAAQPDTTPTSIESELRTRAASFDALHRRVAPAPHDLAAPRWGVASIGPAQIRFDDGPRTWAAVRAAVALLLTDPLDATASMWRVHLYGPVTGAPRAAGPVWVLVLQVSHVLADGRGAAALARALLGGGPPPAAPRPSPRAPGSLSMLTGAAAVPPRLTAALATGLVAWGLTGRGGDGAPAMAATALNRVPGPGRRIDMVVVDAARLTRDGASVTTSVLALLADVLPAYLGTADPGLAVELTVGRGSGKRKSHARNDFHNVTIGLQPHIADRGRRAEAIAGEIAAARSRDREPARRAGRWADDLAPPVLRALAARLTAAAPAPERVAGATVVSSVHRGPADLTLGGGTVLFTAGFPALSAAHALTVGVHGIGDAVTLSFTTSPDVVEDADRLIGLVRTAISA
ncbi:hypothetical protein [Gordonia sp. FQ]|uniref:hypothetical protein n=1 Tax=Gordonia sp. FQ TaxID=3446634 RepID=UPI003F837C33